MLNAAGKKILRDVRLAFARVHVLHHAAEEQIFGLAMMEELKRHGYDISPGTMYPLLHALETAGTLASIDKVVNGKIRKYYQTTKAGDAVLLELRAKIHELVEEVLDPGPHEKARRRRNH